MANSTANKHSQTLQNLLSVAIKNGSAHGESTAEVEAMCRFVAASFYYRDFPSIEQILARENDSAIVEAAHEAMRRAGLRSAK